MIAAGHVDDSPRPHQLEVDTGGLAQIRAIEIQDLLQPQVADLLRPAKGQPDFGML